jgi:hypothetical protein
VAVDSSKIPGTCTHGEIDSDRLLMPRLLCQDFILLNLTTSKLDVVIQFGSSRIVISHNALRKVEIFLKKKKVLINNLANLEKTNTLNNTFY